MAHPSNIPGWDAYQMSRLPPGAVIPDGNFLLPVCTNKTRLQSILNALSSYRSNEDFVGKRDIEHLIDVLEAMNHINECVTCGNPEIPTNECDTCKNYPPDVRFIEWQPANPHRTPDLEPPGYTYPPWSVASAGNVLFDAGTVYTDLARLPINFVDMITSLDFPGFPRFKVKFSGTGRVLLYLQQIPLGGLALITLDGDPLSSEFVDLSSVDLLALADWVAVLETLTDDDIEGGINALRIVEINISEPGDHYIDVTMLPKISTDNILGFGGAFQKVELCGFSQIETCPDCPEPETPQVRAGTDCIEWLNPATQMWECIASYGELGLEKATAAICEVCGCECDDCEDDMSCNCKDGLLRVDPCNPNQLQVMKNGQWENYSLSGAISNANAPTAPEDETPIADNACYKANGVWELVSRAADAFFDSMMGNPIFDAYADAQKSHPEIKWDNTKLMLAAGDFAADTIAAGTLTHWTTNKATIKDEFVCAMQYLFDKTTVLSDDELTIARAHEFSTGSNQLNDVLERVIELPESSQFKQYANNAAITQTGECNCVGNEPVDPDAPPSVPLGSYAMLFKQFSGGINWYPGNVWGSLAAAFGSTPRGTKVGSNVWQLQFANFDEPTQGNIYDLGMILEFGGANATTVHSVNFTLQANAGAGYTAPKVLWHTGVNPAAAWNEEIPSPDGGNPIPASQTFNVGMNASNVKYLAIWVNAVWSGSSANPNKVAKLNPVWVDVTIGGTRYTIAVPNQIFTP